MTQNVHVQDYNVYSSYRLTSWDADSRPKARRRAGEPEGERSAGGTQQRVQSVNHSRQQKFAFLKQYLTFHIWFVRPKAQLARFPDTAKGPAPQTPRTATRMPHTCLPTQGLRIHKPGQASRTHSIHICPVTCPTLSPSLLKENDPRSLLRFPARGPALSPRCCGRPGCPDARCYQGKMRLLMYLNDAVAPPGV